MGKNKRKELEMIKLNELYEEDAWYGWRSNEWIYKADFLWSNNDFVKGKKSDVFNEYLETFKRGYKNSKMISAMYSYENKNVNCIYTELIDKTSEFIKDNIKNDNLRRYAFIHSLFEKNAFSLGEENEEKYRDYIFAHGVDVFLGNSCCRHKADLLSRVLNSFTDTIKVDVGKDDGNRADHRIISFDYNDRKLFLDSVNPLLYYPVDNYTLLGEEFRDIKSIPTFLLNDYFKEYKEYYNFFNNLYRRTKMSVFKYKELFAEIKGYYDRYLLDTVLIEEYKQVISKDQKELKLICKK